MSSDLFSISPSGVPYPENTLLVADGKGTRAWRGIFDTISSQSAIDGAPLGYLPSTLYQTTYDYSTLSSIVDSNYAELSTQIATGYIAGGINSVQLASTVAWITIDAHYVNDVLLASTTQGILETSNALPGALASTVDGLGTAGYASTLSLYSSVQGLEDTINSLFVGLGTSGYISTASLTSTVEGLGTTGYISSASLYSTIDSLLFLPDYGGHYGVVVTGEYALPFQNFTNLTDAYFSTNQAVTVSNAPLYGFVYGSELPSTVAGLSEAGYVSTTQLTSTTQGILDLTQNIYVDQTNNLYIRDSVVYMSSVNALIFMSSFINSSITVKGESGLITGTPVLDSNFYFSTAQISIEQFSSFIVSSSVINLEVLPNYMFPPLTPGALHTYTYTMSSFLQRGTTILPSIHNTRVYGTSATDGFSNTFQQPIRMSFTGSTFMGKYDEPYILSHYMPGALSFNLNVGFRDPVVDAYFGSTSAIYLTVQNLHF